MCVYIYICARVCLSECERVCVCARADGLACEGQRVCALPDSCLDGGGWGGGGVDGCILTCLH